jgi:hypothetical protein
MANLYMIEAKPKRGGDWKLAGLYRFPKKAEFGSMKSLRRNNPNYYLRFKKVYEGD